MRDISLKAYAKVNLTLDVCGLRSDGFHEVDTIMHRIDLFDEVRVRWFPSKRTSDVAILMNSSYSFIPNDSRNIAYKAAQVMSPYAPSGGQVRIDILKKIPVGSGMGGGSADGAAVIDALDSIWELNFSLDKKTEIAAEFGSDTAFGVMMINGISCARARGKGDELDIITGLNTGGDNTTPPYTTILVKPNLSVSTKRAYQLIDNAVEQGKHLPRPDNDRLQAEMTEGRNVHFREACANVFEKPVFAEKSIIAKIKQDVETNLPDAELVQMSGSGSTVFAVMKSENVDEQVVQAIESLKRKYRFVSKADLI